MSQQAPRREKAHKLCNFPSIYSFVTDPVPLCYLSEACKGDSTLAEQNEGQGKVTFSQSDWKHLFVHKK